MPSLRCSVCGREALNYKPCEGCGDLICVKCHPSASARCVKETSEGRPARPANLLEWVKRRLYQEDD
jgi:hypothetical protein